MENKKNNVLYLIIFCLFVCLILSLVFCFYLKNNSGKITEVVSEQVSKNQLNINDEVILSSYIEDMSTVESVSFKNGNIMSVEKTEDGSDYIIMSKEVGSDVLNVRFTNGEEDNLEFECVDKNKYLHLGDTLNINEYLNSEKQVKSIELRNGVFSLNDKTLTINHVGNDVVVVTYTDDSEESIYVTCKDSLIELSVGETYELNVVNAKEIKVSDESFFTVSDNKVTSVQEGNAILTVINSDNSEVKYELKTKVDTSNAANKAKYKVTKYRCVKYVHNHVIITENDYKKFNYGSRPNIGNCKRMKTPSGYGYQYNCSNYKYRFQYFNTYYTNDSNAAKSTVTQCNAQNVNKYKIILKSNK